MGYVDSFAGLRRPVLETERLRLSEPVPSDTADIVAAVNDLEVTRWLARVPHPYTEANAAFLFAHVVPSSIVFALRRRADDAVLGLMGLDPSGEVELGYWLGRPFWGQGYATEAGRAVLAFAFGTLDRPRVLSGVFEGNEASARVLAKLGFRVVGRSMRDSLALGRAVPHIVMVCERPGAAPTG